MPLKPALFLTSALAVAGLMAAPISAQAGGMTHAGTWGGAAGSSPAISGLSCDMPAAMQKPVIPPVHVQHPNTNTYGFAHSQANMGTGPVPHPSNFGGNRPLNVQGNFAPRAPVNVQAPNVRARSGFAGGSQINNVNLNQPADIGNHIENFTPLTTTKSGMSNDGQNAGGSKPGHGHKDAPVNTYTTINKPVTVNNNVNNSKNITINKPVSITNNIDASKNITINKPISIYKPVTIENNIDNSKNISITKNIDASKNINISKSIEINKNIAVNSNNTSWTINKGGSGGQGGGGGSGSGSTSSTSDSAALALAAAIAQLSNTITITNNNNSSASATGGNATGGNATGGNTYVTVEGSTVTANGGEGGVGYGGAGGNVSDINITGATGGQGGAGGSANNTSTVTNTPTNNFNPTNTNTYQPTNTFTPTNTYTPSQTQNQYNSGSGSGSGSTNPITVTVDNSANNSNTTGDNTATGTGYGGTATANGNGGNATSNNTNNNTAANNNTNTNNATGSGNGSGSGGGGPATGNGSQQQTQQQQQNNTNNNGNYSAGNGQPYEGQVVGQTPAGGSYVGHAGGVALTDMAGNYGHGYGYGYTQGLEQPAPVQGYGADNSFVGGQCHFVQATVIKSIHAVCVSADGHQFPASHMTPDTWINSGYEGEVARCLPGSTLRVLMGSVMQSNQGMATSYEDAEALMCGAGEAVRHYKDGMLKCAPAQKVVDCTERTNLRKYGTGDMFFTYVTQVCLEQHHELVGGLTRESAEDAAARAQSYAKAQAVNGNASALHLSGMSLNGGVGGLGFY